MRGYKDQGCHLSGLGTEIGQRIMQSLTALSPLGENPEVSKFPWPPPPTHHELPGLFWNWLNSTTVFPEG